MSFLWYRGDLSLLFGIEISAFCCSASSSSSPCQGIPQSRSIKSAQIPFLLTSAKTGSAIDVRIDDAGSILNFRIGFSLWFSALVNQLSPLVLEASRGSILNFRIGFLSSIGEQLPYPCLPTPFPILRNEEALQLRVCQGQQLRGRGDAHHILLFGLNPQTYFRTYF